MSAFEKLTARFCLLVSCVLFTAAGVAAEQKPNIIFILADDLGYGDVAAYGQKKFRTSNVDRLAAEGMRFTQHYSGSPVCAPSRCVLMTGMHPGHAQVRDNREAQPEGQFPLEEGTQTLARVLQSNGWVTGAFGKWGLGGPGSTGDPLKQGFDRFFGYNCQRVAHNYYPTSLWDNATMVPLKNHAFAAHQKLPADADANDAASYVRYSGTEYAPDLIAEQAVQFVRENRDRSFFLYYPSTVPHLALQVPEDSLAEYRGKFPEEPYAGGRYLPHLTPRAAYAAMITRFDRDIGRVLETVRELGLEERTIVIFTSDNGATTQGLGGTDAEFFESTPGMRGSKGSLYEGGVRVPCIVRWKGRVSPGTTSDRVTAFEDWMPTLLELAGFAGATPRGIDGISFAPTLLRKAQPDRPFLYREFAGYRGQQSVRVGAWKAVRQNLQAPNRPVRTELYNLTRDSAESRDVSAEFPDVLARLEKLLRREHTPSADFPLRALSAAAADSP